MLRIATASSIGISASLALKRRTASTTSSR
jgi:hypothetical protein